MKRQTVVAIALSLFLVPAPAPAAHAPFGDTLMALYGWVLAHPGAGIPKPADRQKLATVLSPELVQLLADAATAERACVKRAPKDEKPLIVEGDLFTGTAEGATEVAYGSERLDGADASIEVTLTHVDKRFAKAHRHRAHSWSSVITLRSEDQRWIVIDIRFPDGETLVGVLKRYLADTATACK